MVYGYKTDLMKFTRVISKVNYSIFFFSANNEWNTLKIQGEFIFEILVTL